MKKFYILATVVIALAACSNEEESEKSWNGEIRLSAVEAIQTRAAGQAIQSTVFDSGEEVDVFINEDATSPSATYLQPIVYKTNSSGALTSTTSQYYPQSGNGINIFAVYPSGVAGEDVEATEVEFSVKEDQSTEENYKASDLMVGSPASNPVAKTSSNVELTFKHCLSKINLNILAGDGLTINDLNGAEVIIGGVNNSATFNVKTGEVTASTEAEGSGIIELGRMTVDNGAIAVSAIVIPQTIGVGTDLFKIVVGPDTRTPTVYVYTVQKAETFDTSAAYTYNITVKKSGISISSPTITDWTDGGTANVDATQIP